MAPSYEPGVNHINQGENKPWTWFWIANLHFLKVYFEPDSSEPS